MGGQASSIIGSLGEAGSWILSWGPGPPSPPAHPPKVVLVPPFFKRDVEGLARFCHSSYDVLPARKALQRLLSDHLAPELSAALLLSPRGDPRVSVRAKMRRAGGSMVLRWQPTSPAVTHTFLELAARLGAGRQSSGSHVLLRGSYLHPGSGLGIFGVVPLEAGGGKGAQVGVRYSSPEFTSGAIFAPSSGGLQKIWLAGRLSSFTLGLQVSPDTPVRHLLPVRHLALVRHLFTPAPDALLKDSASTASSVAAAATVPLPPESTLLPTPAGADVAGSGGGGSGGGGVLGREWLSDVESRVATAGGWLRSRTSVMLAYSPAVAAGGSGGPPFTAAVEVVGGRSLTLSFFQHMAATRRVVNPFEEDEVVGITNYLDIGLQLTTPIGPGALTGESVTLRPQAHPSHLAAASGGGDGGTQVEGSEAVAAGGVAPPSATAGVGSGWGEGAAPASSPPHAPPPSIDFAAAWQVNKNWLVKVRAGSGGAAAVLGARVWHAVSAYLTATVALDWGARVPRYGVELCVENFGPLRYERGHGDVAAGRALLQRHLASAQELDNAAGRGVTVLQPPAPHPVPRGSLSPATLEEESRRVAALL